jgi:hypothetical protein
MSEVSIFSVDTLIKYMGNDDKARPWSAKSSPTLRARHGAFAAGWRRSARVAGDAAKMLHTLRGAIGTLGAKRLVSASLELENFAGPAY